MSDSMKLACVFPGQGAQAIGMLHDLAAAFPVIRHSFEEASESIDVDLWSLVSNGPEAELDRTQNTQPAMLAAGVGTWRAWCGAGGVQPCVMAGHSLGEYTALVCAGVLDFREAASLVRERGQLMQEAVKEKEGAMAAILGLGDAEIADICARAASDEVVSAANFNAPGQVVIAGHAAAVERAMELAGEAGAKRVVRLRVSVPAHCSLMLPAARKLAARLAESRVERPQIPVVHNADVEIHSDQRAIKEALTRQLHGPVRWVETVQAFAARGVTKIVELGPGKVLTALNRRIDKSLHALCVHDPDSLEQALKNVQNAT